MENDKIRILDLFREMEGEGDHNGYITGKGIDSRVYRCSLMFV
jgi:hypothetical protein